MVFLTNEIINSVYEILGSHESNKNIWFARNNKNNKKIVIKVKDLDNFNSDECEAAIKFGKHVNLSYCYWIKNIHNKICLAYEYVDGSDLREYWEKSKNFSNYEIILCIILQLIESVSFIGKNGYVLQDITPENIYVINGKGNLPIIKLIDFDAIYKIGKNNNLIKQKIGRFKYMSIESFIENSETNIPAEVSIESVTYSIGLIFYQMISKSHRTPFEDLESDLLSIEEWYLLHSKIGNMFKDNPDFVYFGKIFHEDLQNQNNEDDVKNSILRTIYFIIEECCKKKSERMKLKELKDILINSIIKEYLFDNSSNDFKEFINKINRHENSSNPVHSDDLNNKGLSMICLSKCVSNCDPFLSKEYIVQAKEYFQLATQKNCKHFESRINLLLLNYEYEPFNFNIIHDLKDLIMEFQRQNEYFDLSIYGMYFLSYYLLLLGKIDDSYLYIQNVLKNIKKLKSPLKISEDEFHFIHRIIEFNLHKKGRVLDMAFFKKNNFIYGERVDRLYETSQYKHKINNWSLIYDNNLIDQLIHTVDDFEITSISKYSEEKYFSYACFSQIPNGENNNNINQTILALDTEGKIHRLIEKKYYKNNEEIKYFDNLDLKSKGGKVFVYITSSYDGQTILALDTEGKLILWSKNDYDDEYYENTKLAKTFNESGQRFSYACFSTLSQSNYLITEIKNKKELVLWLIDRVENKLIFKQIFYLDSNNIKCTNFSPDFGNLIYLDQKILNKIQFKNMENREILNIVNHDNYLFSSILTSFKEDQDNDKKIREIIDDVYKNLEDRNFKKAQKEFTNLRNYSNYTNFEDIKKLLLSGMGEIIDLSEITETCHLVDFSTIIKYPSENENIDKEKNEMISCENTIFKSGIYTLNFTMDSNYGIIFNIQFDINKDINKKTSIDFYRSGSGLFELLNLNTLNQFIVCKKNELDLKNIPRILVDKIMGKNCSGFYLSKNKSFAVVITSKGEISCYSIKNDKFKKQFSDSFPDKSFTDLCFNRNESIFMASTSTGEVYIFRKDGYLIKNIINSDQEPIFNTYFSHDNQYVLIISNFKIRVFVLKWNANFKYPV
ncbi:MAG TPA: protein kinase [Verrucomicrobiae bacterium]|nr:protein kinase [Verrucomicrobiae bacterium]